MASINIVILGGNLSADPELRYTPGGTAVADFNLAVNRTWSDADGNKKEEVSFFTCVFFGKRAETIAEWFRKGDPIVVQGRIKQETWEDRETGKKRSAVKFIGDSFNFAGKTKRANRDSDDGDHGGREARQTRRSESAKPKAEEPQQAELPADDDVPF